MKHNGQTVGYGVSPGVLATWKPLVGKRGVYHLNTPYLACAKELVPVNASVIHALKLRMCGTCQSWMQRQVEQGRIK